MFLVKALGGDWEGPQKLSAQLMLTVLSTLALKGVLEKLQPPGYELRFDSTQAILKRMSGGEHADVLILTAEAMDDLQAKGRVTQVRALGSSGVSVAVRKGALETADRLARKRW